jgi:hypothetical protein
VDDRCVCPWHVALLPRHLPLGSDEVQWLTVIDKRVGGQTSVRELIPVRFSRLETVV